MATTKIVEAFHDDDDDDETSFFRVVRVAFASLLRTVAYANDYLLSYRRKPLPPHRGCPEADQYIGPTLIAATRGAPGAAEQSRNFQPRRGRATGDLASISHLTEDQRDAGGHLNLNVVPPTCDHACV